MNIQPLALAILALVSPNGIVPTHFSEAPLGPLHRAESLATTFTLAADKHDVDLSLLVALAKWESDFDHNAVSSVGAFGELQLLPRWHRDIRGYCFRHPELCGVAVIDRGAQVLARHKRKCVTDGRAVRAYRKGHCAPPVANTYKVLRTARWLRKRIGGKVEIL